MTNHKKRAAWRLGGVLGVGAIAAMLAAGRLPLVIGSFSALLGLCWLYCAVFNGAVAGRMLVGKAGRVPSAIPLVGGICAFLGLMGWQLGHQHAVGRPLAYPLPLLLLSLLLDYGSLPYVIVYILPALWRQR